MVTFHDANMQQQTSPRCKLVHLALMLGLLARRVAREVCAVTAMESHVSPLLTTATVVQSWPTRPRQRISLTNRLAHFASIMPLLTLASWKLVEKGEKPSTLVV